MKPQLNQELAHRVNVAFAAPKAMLIIVGIFFIVLGTVFLYLGYDSWNALAPSTSNSKVPLIAGIIFVCFGNGMIALYVFFRTPENTPLGRLLTVRKDKVKRIFKLETQVTLLGKSTNTSFYRIIVTTKERPNLSKAPAFFVAKDELDILFDTIKNEFQGYNVIFN